jgi:hypothetical protein
MRRRTVCVLGLLAALGAASCAGFNPAPVEQVAFLERAISERRGDLEVTVAVPTVEEARRLFDAKLHKKRIQPVWIEVRNRGHRPAWVFPYAVDPDYFPPLEVAWKIHRTWAKKTNRRIDAYLYRQSLVPQVAAGGRQAGFVFVNLDRGSKHVPVGVLREDGLTEFDFVVEVPGFKADHTLVDFDGLYAEDEYLELADEQALREWISNLPCCTVNKKGTRTGDPINFVLVGTREGLDRAIVVAGWDETASMRTGSAIKTAASAVFGKSYRYAPISPLYAFGRPQDAGLQKARWNVHQRNHLRLWLAPARYRGNGIMIGQISRDIGTRITTKSPTLTTHKIDPDVDEARDFLVLDFWNAGVLSAFGYTTGVGRRDGETPGRNLTGDPYVTDGLRAVMMLSAEPVAYEDVQFLDWERPGERERGRGR